MLPPLCTELTAWFADPLPLATTHGTRMGRAEISQGRLTSMHPTSRYGLPSSPSEGGAHIVSQSSDLNSDRQALCAFNSGGDLAIPTRWLMPWLQQDFHSFQEASGDYPDLNYRLLGASRQPVLPTLLGRLTTTHWSRRGYPLRDGFEWTQQCRCARRVRGRF